MVHNIQYIKDVIIENMKYGMVIDPSQGSVYVSGATIRNAHTGIYIGNPANLQQEDFLDFLRELPHPSGEKIAFLQSLLKAPKGTAEATFNASSVGKSLLERGVTSTAFLNNLLQIKERLSVEEIMNGFKHLLSYLN